MKKKLLVVCYYWPPNASIATHRWLHMSNYLAEQGYDVHVMVPDSTNHPIVDKALSSLVSSKLTIVKSKFFEIRNIFSRQKQYRDQSKLDDIFFKDKKALSTKEKIMLWVRGNIFIPDARVSWYYSRKSFIKKYIQKNKIDVFITSGTPHSVHLFGLYLKKSLNTKWIADFRDPWTGIEYHHQMMMSSWARKKHLRLEKAVVQQADALSTVSNQWAKDFKKLGAKNIHVILNGFEEKTFEGIEYTPNKEFIICHTGTMRADRNPSVLWQVLKQLKLDGIEIRTHLYGNVAEEIKNEIRKYGLTENVTSFKSVAHRKIVEIMQGSTLLLLLVNADAENSMGRIPAKIFEYIRSRRPIVLIGNKKGDAAKIIEHEKIGQNFDQQDFQSLYDYLKKQYTAFKNGSLLSTNTDVSKYSRETMAIHYSELIESI